MLAVLALGAGCAGAQTGTVRTLLALLALAVAAWAVVLRLTAGMPLPLALAVVGIQVPTLTILYLGYAMPAGYWQTWEGGLARGAALGNLLFWGGFCLRWAVRRGWTSVFLAGITGSVCGFCASQFGVLSVMPAAALTGTCLGLAAAIALLCFVGRARSSTGRGWYDLGYLTAV